MAWDTPIRKQFLSKKWHRSLITAGWLLNVRSEECLAIVVAWRRPLPLGRRRGRWGRKWCGWNSRRGMTSVSGEIVGRVSARSSRSARIFARIAERLQFPPLDCRRLYFREPSQLGWMRGVGVGKWFPWCREYREREVARETDKVNQHRLTATGSSYWYLTITESWANFRALLLYVQLPRSRIYL